MTPDIALVQDFGELLTNGDADRADLGMVLFSLWVIVLIKIGVPGTANSMLVEDQQFVRGVGHGSVNPAPMSGNDR